LGRSEGAELSDLLERLRARGWRVTPQRRVVAEVLSGEHVHLSAEAIHLAAQQRLEEISLATVYNTLNELVAMGEVLEVAADSGPKRYDPNAHSPHHHLVCTRCGAMRDVDLAGGAALDLSPAEPHGFRLGVVDVVFRGLCPDCQRAEAAQASAGTVPSKPLR
jgi:Fur family transcriptional regulator, stress-responsive regulator